MINFRRLDFTFNTVCHRLWCACCLVLVGLTLSAHAQLNIEIAGVGSRLYPIAIGSFERDSTGFSESLSAIVRADLARSGRFRLIEAGSTAFAESSVPNLGVWKDKGASAFVSGSVLALASGQFEVRFRVFDVNKQSSVGGLSFSFEQTQARLAAHKVADAIYEMLLGEPGIFATRLSYVSRQGKRFQLMISDSDGANPQTALSSTEPIISPAWSPDGRKVAYVSFEQRKPIIYVHDLPTGKRSIASNVKGNNSAPAWSPDGQFLVLALSRDGNTQIYKATSDGRNLQRLSVGGAIDTEPQFSHDGRFIYFTSDRGGAPQIYRMSAQNGERNEPAERITFRGNYNTSPRISPDGKRLAFITRKNGIFRLVIQDLTTAQVSDVSNTDFDDSPSFAANGQYLLYATRLNGKSVLVASTIDGQVHHVLSMPAGEVREPAWGPFSK
ncbi:MAG: Tol-Pal system protein TolB [Ottowia sp.]|nr:Tol-Pal system protein TolB [Ottowia sp.]